MSASHFDIPQVSSLEHSCHELLTVNAWLLFWTLNHHCCRWERKFQNYYQRRYSL